MRAPATHSSSSFPAGSAAFVAFVAYAFAVAVAVATVYHIRVPESHFVASGTPGKLVEIVERLDYSAHAVQNVEELGCPEYFGGIVVQLGGSDHSGGIAVRLASVAHSGAGFP